MSKHDPKEILPELTSPIAVAAERTGLTQDVLRAWERRYGAVQPGRGPNGQRIYTSADLERLKLLRAAVHAGRSIGQIAQLSSAALALIVSEDLASRVSRATPESVDDGRDDYSSLLAEGMELVRVLDTAGLNDLLRRAAAMLGANQFLMRIAAPLLRRVGDEWHAGQLSISQEHFASSMLHDVVTEIMRGFGHREGAPRVLVATPAGDRHAIGAAIVGASAGAQGWSVTYLGADLPAEEIARAAVATNADLVALSVVYVENRDQMVHEISSLRMRLPSGTSILIGGGGAAGLGKIPGVLLGESLTDLFRIMEEGNDGK